ncbi:hypothetical protein Cadr_000010282 [Camelus dromedarius]|uniref:Uncharacterized protein n=1 Tax=Camelus dromedarius TaxID=9838 RepID=A0A5N4DWL8_CAMDR|nr:hypothetical protein Cadr_000010282 [Camelus dromedarius]
MRAISGQRREQKLYYSSATFTSGSLGQKCTSNPAAHAHRILAGLSSQSHQVHQMVVLIFLFQELGNQAPGADSARTPQPPRLVCGTAGHHALLGLDLNTKFKNTRTKEKVEPKELNDCIS